MCDTQIGVLIHFCHVSEIGPTRRAQSRDSPGAAPTYWGALRDALGDHLEHLGPALCFSQLLRMCSQAIMAH